ncbi:DUF3048 domain-containing protein [Blastococcus goldschmidtiae]|uniref:DUF3048 domain-containing protein n=1 Tax=Blastococcus goldschmidtiae TaxID=3075546 RepID=A0ABU2K938_9ACTN|nr:DUF3048 domain-containing protein [Blastococcus sp. DSM 46792]MDT0276691.1 DUF3048 domain-containing protein [Blastococcus sp. DSM 46792]
MSHRMLTRRRLGRTAAALTMTGALALTAACGAEETKPAAASDSPAPVAPPAPALVPWPLTGVEVEAVPARPALAVKIENSVAARPQSGLNAADVVWEQVVEGGITRFVAVFHSTLPPDMGPVRSVRPMDAAIAGPLRGLFAFSGGGPAYIRAIADTGAQVVSQNSGADGYFRLGTRPAPHNVYADPAKLLAQADPGHQAQPAGEFVFARAGQPPTAVALGAPASAVQLTLSASSRPNWTWSQPDNGWLRAEGETPATGADGARLRAANVVVLRVDVVNTAARDGAGNPVPETVMVGGGEAIVASGGSTIAATWSKASPTDPLLLSGPGGAPVELAPGNTWVELVPNGTGSVALG